MVTESTAVVDFFGKSRKFIRMTDEELAAIIGANVRAARTAAKLTQRGLADVCGIAFPHISRLENGAHLPSVRNLKKVADALKVPICSLLDPPEEKTQRKEPKKSKEDKS